VLYDQLRKIAAYSKVLRKTASTTQALPKAVGQVANHFKNQAGKHGVLPVAGSIAGGAMLMSSAAKAPSKYKQFKQGFRPENHQIGARVGE
jgi:hypothetical protein